MRKLFIGLLVLAALAVAGCAPEMVGDDKDEHGCIGSAGYQWCPSTQQCQRMWETYCEEYKDQFKVDSFESCVLAGNPVMESYPRQCAHEGQTFTEASEDEEQLIGGDRDEHNCLVAAGYAYDESVGACTRSWELDEAQKEAARVVMASLGSEGWTVVEVASADMCETCFTVTLDRNEVMNTVSVAEGAVISATGGEWACTREYMPVCGMVQVQCVTEPCDPIMQTFGNRCTAEAAGAFDIIEGECVDEGAIPPQPVMRLCDALGGEWDAEYRECLGISEQECVDMGGSFDECASACRHDPKAEVCTMQCVVVCSLP